MRTTVELPPALLRAAKARSAEHGESLKALLTRAVEAELDQWPRPSEDRRRVRLPLIGSPVGTRTTPSNDDLARALADADAAAAHVSRAEPTRRIARRRRP